MKVKILFNLANRYAVYVLQLYAMKNLFQSYYNVMSNVLSLFFFMRIANDFILGYIHIKITEIYKDI